MTQSDVIVITRYLWVDTGLWFPFQVAAYRFLPLVTSDRELEPIALLWDWVEAALMLLTKEGTDRPVWRTAGTGQVPLNTATDCDEETDEKCVQELEPCQQTLQIRPGDSDCVSQNTTHWITTGFQSAVYTHSRHHADNI